MLMHVKSSGSYIYLLVDENVFIAFFVLIRKVQLDLPQIGPLLEQLSFDGKLLFLYHFSLPDHSHDFSRLLKLLPKLLELLCAMGISATSLPNLSDFSSSKADIGIGIVSIGACLELDSVSWKSVPTQMGRRATLSPVIRDLLPASNLRVFQCS